MEQVSVVFPLHAVKIPIVEEFVNGRLKILQEKQKGWGDEWKNLRAFLGLLKK